MVSAPNASLASTNKIIYAILVIHHARPVQIQQTVSPARMDTTGAYPTEDCVPPAQPAVQPAMLQQSAIAVSQDFTSIRATA